MLTRGEAELRATLEREIPLRVGTEIDRKLADVGITRDTGRQIANLLALTERIGLIGLPRRGGGCYSSPPIPIRASARRSGSARSTSSRSAR